MLQQCKLRVVGSEQEGTCRMHWCTVVSHLRRDNIPFIIFRNVGEVPDGTTAGSKEISVLRLAVQVPYNQRENSPLFIIKRFDHRVDARLNARDPFSSSSLWLHDRLGG